LNLDDIDYFLVLSKNLNSWRVFSSIDSDNNIFLKKRGVINKIETYKVKDNT